jgi:hypothetical protein
VTVLEPSTFELEKREFADAMKTWYEIKEIEQRRICGDCVGEEYLGVQIQSRGDDENCYYCDSDTRTIPVGELATEINSALESHYSRTSIDPEGYEYYLQKVGNLWRTLNGNPTGKFGALIDRQIDSLRDIWPT